MRALHLAGIVLAGALAAGCSSRGPAGALIPAGMPVLPDTAAAPAATAPGWPDFTKAFSGYRPSLAGKSSRTRPQSTTVTLYIAGTLYSSYVSTLQPKHAEQLNPGQKTATVTYANTVAGNNEWATVDL